MDKIHLFPNLVRAYIQGHLHKRRLAHPNGGHLRLKVGQVFLNPPRGKRRITQARLHL